MARPRPPTRETPPELGVVWRPAWKLNDPNLKADAKVFWERLGLLPNDADAEARVQELVAVAYADGRAVAVATAYLRPLEFLRARFAMFRCAVDPEYRLNNLSRKATGVAREILEAWAEAHPEEGVKGMATVLENREMLASSRRAIWRTSGLALMGYTAADEQIRVAWFEDARV